MIAEGLAGKRIVITGSTGFVGTALVERLLRSVPGCELVLLVRDGKRTPAARRVQRELLRNDAFDRLREQHDGPDPAETFAEMTERRITTIAGDVSADGLGLNDADRAVFATADVIIHSAATVSFDSPLDRAVEINLLGPVRIAELCHDLGVRPHLVAVSTCYVAGNRRGNAPEQLEMHDISAGRDGNALVGDFFPLQGFIFAVADRQLGFRHIFRQPDHLQRPGAVREPADETAFLQRRDQPMNARLAAQVEGGLHFVKAGRNTVPLHAAMDKFQQIQLLLGQHCLSIPLLNALLFYACSRFVSMGLRRGGQRGR